jgi:hypothetical protein
MIKGAILGLYSALIMWLHPAHLSAVRAPVSCPFLNSFKKYQCTSEKHLTKGLLIKLLSEKKPTDDINRMRTLGVADCISKRRKNI